MAQFHETRMGARFFEHDFPEMVKAVQAIAESMPRRGVSIGKDLTHPDQLIDHLNAGKRVIQKVWVVVAPDGGMTLCGNATAVYRHLLAKGLDGVRVDKWVSEPKDYEWKGKFATGDTMLVVAKEVKL